MADKKIVNADLDAAIEKTSGLPPDADELQQDAGPIYRMMPGSKILVSKQLGKLFKSRIEQSKAARADIETAWSEAIRYYSNDQMAHRNATGGNRSGNRVYQRTINDQWSETENVVFSNTVTMLPMLYAKNPNVACTATSTANEAYAECCQALINAVLNMKTAPGVNLKSKARRGVLWVQLTNSAYTKVDFITKEDSSEEAMTELASISEAYSKAKTKKEIQELEGKLMALEAKINVLNPSGPKVTLVSPYRLYWDPTASEPDHSDALWAAEYDYLPTDYINAVYAKRHEQQWVSVYEPSHILRSSNSGSELEDQVSNFSIFNKDPEEEAKNYGYDSMRSFRAACYTKVWWIWDKVTRRVLLYCDNKWDWPLWVWDDPLKLIEFFPYDHLWFHETTEGSQPKGEVTYYLDQQDAINDINSEIARARAWVRLNVFFNSNKIKQDDAEAVLKGPDGTARGIPLEDGEKMDDVIWSPKPPALVNAELFQVDTKFAAINRITGINDAQRGAQFKTNTTNEAVNAYQKNIDIRVDEKVDAIEDWIGMIAWKLLQLLARHWTQEQVAELIGKEYAQSWVQITDPNDLRTRLNIRIVGGSTEKPTSKMKKKAALEIGQVLGQFAGGIPAVAIVMLKIFERAFKDDIVITKEDWDMILKSMEDNTNKAGAGPGGAEGDPNAAPEGDPKEQIKQLIASLPPEAQQKLQQLVQSGVPPTEALKQVAQPQANQTT